MQFIRQSWGFCKQQAYQNDLKRNYDLYFSSTKGKGILNSEDTDVGVIHGENCTNFRLKKLKRITEYNGLGGKYLKSDVLEISDFVDRDGPLDDNFDEPIHESWLHMQDANETKALSFVLTVKWPFLHVETVNIMAPLSYMYKLNWILFSSIHQK